MKLFILLAAIISLSAQANTKYLVKVKNSKVFQKQTKSFLKVESIGKFFPDVFTIEGNDNKKDLESFLKNNPDIIHYEKNVEWKVASPLSSPLNYSPVRTPITPNDELFYQQWALHNPNSQRSTLYNIDLDMLKAWEITKGSRDITIAIIDTGIDYNHPDLKGNIYINELEKNGKKGVDDDGNGFVDDVYGYDFANDMADGLDDNGHGTHCAGVIGALHNNEIGIAGVMPEVKLLPVKFLDYKGSGDTVKALKSINYALTMKVDIMSNSWGGNTTSLLIEEAISKTRDAGIYFVAAAGNNSMDIDETPVYPASYSTTHENVITVASHGRSSQLSRFSNYGIKSVHVSAPGEDITSTMPEGNYQAFSGTSMAAPHVSGMLGLLLAQTKKQKFTLSFEEVKRRITKTSIPNHQLRDIQSSGRIHVTNFLKDMEPARPDEKLWKTYKLAEPYESAHPYPLRHYDWKKITVPGAKFIRVVIKKYDMDDGFDFLRIEENGSILHRYTLQEFTGKGENVITDYLEGDSIIIEYETRSVSQGNWGFRIEEVQYID